MKHESVEILGSGRLSFQELKILGEVALVGSKRIG
jgi:hypothetical protein